jgi:hypothetical protein
VILVTWQHTGFEAAEEAVAVASYGVVGRVAEKFWDQLQQGCNWGPRACELLQDEEDGVGAGEEEFVGKSIVEDNIDRVEVAGVGPVAGEDAGDESALQRGETEERIAIAAENELDQAIAESANAVVEEDGVGHAYIETLAPARSKAPSLRLAEGTLYLAK